MSDDARRLLEAIIAAPDDDAPRLVYADWLQGRGDPLGELILLQCQLAAAPDDDRRRPIKTAENKLRKLHEAGWTRPLHEALPTPIGFAAYKFEHVRGFVEDAQITLTSLPQLARLFELAPLLRRLAILPGGLADYTERISQPVLDRALDAPEFARLVTLEIGLGGGGNAIAFAVADAPTLSGLRELRISASIWGEMAYQFNAPLDKLVLDDAGALALATSPHLAGVEHLYLPRNRITVEGVRAIAQGAWRLRTLDLGDNVLGSEGLAEALAGPALAGLEVLSLADGAQLQAKDAAALARCPTLANLRELDLEKCHLGAVGTAAFCKALALPALRRLRLERNSLGDAGAKAIAECAALATLTSFEAGHNRMGQKGAAALATSPHLTNLERLLLNEPRWKPETAQLFADSPTLANARIYLRGKLLARAKSKDSVTEPAEEKPIKKPAKKRAPKTT